MESAIDMVKPRYSPENPSPSRSQIVMENGTSLGACQPNQTLKNLTWKMGDYMLVPLNYKSNLCAYVYLMLRGSSASNECHGLQSMKKEGPSKF
jgi:hypothetical protein